MIALNIQPLKLDPYISFNISKPINQSKPLKYGVYNKDCIIRQWRGEAKFMLILSIYTLERIH